MMFAVLVAIASLGQKDDARAEAKKKLEEALRSPDVRVRLTAVRALPKGPCADVEPLLRIAAADEKFNVRLAVVDKLEEIGAGKPGGCADLRPIATYDDDLSLAEYRTHKMHPATPDTGVQCSSKTDWTALKEKCVHEKALKAIMRGSHKEARYWAAMRAMAEAPAVRGEALRIIRGALSDKTVGPKRPGVEKTEGWAVRWAPLMLEHVSDGVRVPILERALRYRGDGNVSTNAVDAIAAFNIAPAKKLALLEKAAKHKFAQVRWRAARALGAFLKAPALTAPHCDAAERQVRALEKDRSWWVRRAAARVAYGADLEAKADSAAAADRCEAMRYSGRFDYLNRKCEEIRKWEGTMYGGLYDAARHIAGLSDVEPAVRLCAVGELLRVADIRTAMQSADFRVSLRAAGALLGAAK
ncbi:MAG: HEAT repeat domain-containing protein [Deltaproteobacteria bacterium]|nr:HEAT repeat domain-containing protein [Deltaproteobacteria bacterium]